MTAVVNPGIFTTTVNMYNSTFGGYLNQFLQWGEWLFYGLLVIAIVWLCLWKAFDNNSFQESMPSFIKEFFIIAFFYTLMINGTPWLLSMVSTATSMGTKLANETVDPSSIIGNGISISNLIIAPVQNSGILSIGLGDIIVALAYFVVFAAFLFIALDLAITLITTTFLISISSLMFAFAVFPFTRTIARNTLDAVIGNSFKLLCLYAVIAAGNQVFTSIANFIPTKAIGTFDIYGWVVSAALLFALISKSIPSLVARIISNAITEHRGAEAAAIAGSAVRLAQMSMPAVKVAGAATASLAKIAGSGVANATAHFNKASMAPGGNVLSNLGSAMGNTAKDLGSAMGGKLSDQFKSITDKMAGGSGAQKPISGVAERMYGSSQDVKSSYSVLPKNAGDKSAGVGSPSSAGRKTAAPSSTRSVPNNSSKSPPK